jgi:hypothetical protein
VEIASEVELVVQPEDEDVTVLLQSHDTMDEELLFKHEERK